MIVLAGGLMPGRDPAHAGGSWSAWIYNSDTGEMVLTFPDGAAPMERMFPLPPGTSTPPSNIVISPDGSLMAACLYDDGGNPSVRVYDLYAETYTAAFIPTGTIMDCALGRYSFSSDSSMLAFGILYHYTDPSDTRPDWELIVMQANGSAIVSRLASNSPAVTALSGDFAGQMPVAQSFAPGVVAFDLVPWGTEGSREYTSLVWEIESGAVLMDGPYGKNSLDLLDPSGEAIWVEENDAYPKGTLEGPGFLFNVVMYSSGMGEPYPIFNDGPSVLFGSTFIDSGRQIAIQSYSTPDTLWWALDRNGAVTPLPIPGTVYDVWGTLDGYVYLDQSGSAPQVNYDRFAGGPTPEQYTSWTGTAGGAGYWRIVWVNRLVSDAGVMPFAPLPTLGEPPLPSITLVPPIVVTLPPPAVITPSGTSLIVGGHATVHTTEGDQLRVRSGPGTAFAVSFQLPNGVYVTLLEGPVSGNGYNWWRIQTGDGLTGWCIDGLTDNGSWLQTLVPVP
jgi:hypothetical protein